MPPSSTSPHILFDAMPKADRDAVLCFLDMSSRKTRSTEEVLDTLALSLTLKSAHFGAPS